MIWQFLALLTVHWLGDFVFQTHWQASNKSKSQEALLAHVGTYSIALIIGTQLIFLPDPKALLFFAAVNVTAHYVTDFVTSRITSRLFTRQFQILTIRGPTAEISEGPHLIATKDFTLHNFFVVVGIDQLIHQATLAMTMVLFFGS